MVLAFEIRRQIVKNVHVLLYLISRRSRYRAGTRYFRRGIDEDGNVANFNETEQMVFVDKPDSEEQKFPHLLSYVQTRGSVPVYWAEINTLRYKPDLQIMEGEERVRRLALLAPFSFLTSSPTVSRDEEAPYGSGQDIRRADVSEPRGPQRI